MERNAILATALVILILVGYQWYLAQFEAPQQEAQRPAAPAAPAQASAPKAGSLAPAAPARPQAFTPTPPPGTPPREVLVETPLVRIVLSTAGARAIHWELKKYRLDSGAPVDLVAGRTPEAGPGPLQAWADGEGEQAPYLVDRYGLDLTRGEATGTLTFHRVTEAGIEIRKSLTFHADRYEVEATVTARNVSAAEAVAQPRLAWGPGLRNSLDKRASTLKPPTLWVDGKRLEEDLAKLNGEKIIRGEISWAAIEDSYFAVAFLPQAKETEAFVRKGPGDQPVVGLTAARATLPPGEETTLRAVAFVGPRDLDILKGVGQNLDQLVDLGWFDFLARPALWLLKFFYHYTGNYGIAIILVTVLQKIVFHPLTHKSMKSMQAMQAIQPKVQAMQERYKNNPKKKQEETMGLYRKHGVNPMGGCLPMLVQIPIFIALYNALSSSVEMWQAHFLWIRDLTQPDSLFTLTVWGGYSLSANLLALLMGASMFIQQKMTPTAGDPRQAKMMLYMMPTIFTFMFWSFPSGLVLYWLVNNALQIGQQWLILGRPARPAAAEGQAA